METSPKHKPWLLIVFCFLLAGCPAALPILIPPLVQFGASLLDSAINNYDETHQQNMQSLLVALRQRTNPYGGQGTNTSTNGYPQPGYQSQGYPSEPTYPPSQSYPQERYDSYQDSQSQYEDTTQDPYNQDHNPYQQENPYSNDPAYSHQHTAAPGYPPNSQDPYLEQEPTYPDTYVNEEPAYQPYQQPYEGGVETQTGPINVEETSNPPISLDVLLVKKHIVNGAQTYMPIKDGDILRDGRGNAQAGDKFRVMFRANTNCYVYVIAVDGSAWAQGIFPPPSNPFANPVKPGQQYLLPEGNNWFSLDQFKGIETIFVVASHERRPDIEQILTTISGRERHPADTPIAVNQPAIIPNGFSGARPGASPFAFNTSQTSQHQLLPTTYFVKTAGEDLRITRWFRHQ